MVRHPIESTRWECVPVCMPRFMNLIRDILPLFHQSLHRLTILHPCPNFLEISHCNLYSVFWKVVHRPADANPWVEAIDNVLRREPDRILDTVEITYEGFVCNRNE